jgi:enoyl ACP reductase
MPTGRNSILMLRGKRFVITGVLTRQSIAYSVADEALRHGAELVLTSFGRALSITNRAVRGLPGPPEVLELDVTKPEDFEQLRSELAGRWGRIDGVVHAIASAPSDAFGGRFLETSTTSAVEAFLISAVSFRDLTAAMLPLMENGGSVVGLDFDASVAWPVYDWMGVAKASLESISRYLARDLGSRGIRVNLVAAGPIRTVSASGALPDFDAMTRGWDIQAPLGWDPTDPLPVAGAVCFMLSDWSAGVTGEILRVDGGYRALGAPTALSAELLTEATAASGRSLEDR